MKAILCCSEEQETTFCAHCGTKLKRRHKLDPIIVYAKANLSEFTKNHRRCTEWISIENGKQVGETNQDLVEKHLRSIGRATTGIKKWQKWVTLLEEAKEILPRWLEEANDKKE